MEKLKSLRKQRGYTQEYMSKIISTDVSNYSRKESGDVRIYDDEWEKLAKALDVPVEDIKEEKPSSIVQNNDNLTSMITPETITIIAVSPIPCYRTITSCSEVIKPLLLSSGFYMKTIYFTNLLKLLINYFNLPGFCFKKLSHPL